MLLIAVLILLAYFRVLILGLSEMKFNLSLNNCLMTTFVPVALDSRNNKVAKMTVLSYLPKRWNQK